MEAVKATFGRVLSQNGECITAYYFSCSYGHTSDSYDIWGDSAGTMLSGVVQAEEGNKKDLSKHREKLTQIFTMLIERGKALEINTRMISQPQGRQGIEYIISLYTSLGGKKFTLGSDAHDVTKYKSGFEDAKALLKKYGISSVCLSN